MSDGSNDAYPELSAMHGWKGEAERLPPLAEASASLHTATITPEAIRVLGEEIAADSEKLIMSAAREAAMLAREEELFLASLTERLEFSEPRFEPAAPSVEVTMVVTHPQDAATLTAVAEAIRNGTAPNLDEQGHDDFRPRPEQETVLDEAERLVDGPRLSSYGHPLDDFTRTGRIWGALLGIPDIPAEMVGLMMVGLKQSREVNAHGRDNLVDGAGYFRTIEKVHEERARRRKVSQGGTLERLASRIYRDGD